jgi:hypothetical protein
MKTRKGNFAFFFYASFLFAACILSPKTSSAAASPGITTQPQSQSVLVGSNASFSVVASGQTPLIYQWSFNGTGLTNSAHIAGATSATIIINNLVAGDAGNYHVVVSNNHGTATSSNATLTVLFPPGITSQPTNQSVLVNGSVTFSAAATGTGTLFYQWLEDGVNLVNGGRIGGANSSALTVSGIQTNDAGSYQLVVTNNYGSVTSMLATLTVLVPAAIASQPLSQSVFLGSNVTFAATAIGTTPLNYQWYFNGSPLTDGGRVSGSLTTSLTISNIQLSDAGGYTMTASNLVNMAMSLTATLTPVPVMHYVNLNSLDPVPPYTSWDTAATGIQDAIDAATPGDLIFVTNGVYASGGRVAEGMLTNRVVIDKAVTVQSINGPSVTLIQGNPVVASNAVRCVYMAGNATLSGFTLTNGATLNLNDESADEEGAGVWCQSSNEVLTNCIIAGNSAYFSGGGVYGGTLNQCLLLANSAGGNPYYDPGGGASGSILNFCILNGNSGEDGGGAFSSTLNNCLVINNSAVGGGGAYFSTLNSCTVVGNGAWGGGGGVFGGSANNCIIYYNNNVNIQNGGYGSITMTNCCTTPMPFSGSYGTITAEPLFLDQTNGNYHLHINSPCIDAGNNAYVDWSMDLDGNPRIINGTVDIGAYEYQDLPISVIMQPASQTNVMGQTATLTVGAESPYPLSYQWLFNSNNIPGATNSSLVLTNLQVNQSGVYSVVISNSVAVTNSANAIMVVLYPPPTIVQQPTNLSVVLSSNAAFFVAATNYLTMTYQWQLNGTNVTDGGEFTGSTSPVLAISGTQIADAGAYQVIVTTSDGAVTSAVATLTVLVPVTITNQPANLTVLSGNTVSFAVTATGSTPFSYLWYVNGIVLTNGGRVNGATSNLLTLANVQTNDTGLYQVVVTNICSTATSAAASLTVLDPAQIPGQPDSQNVALGGNVTFNITASGSALSYQWFFNGTALTDGGRITGSATSALTITGVQSSDAGGYTVAVTNLLSAVFSHTASLTPQTNLMPSVRYVNVSNASPQTPFLSWSTAATNIQDAIDAAVNGDQILVTNGVYHFGGWAVFGLMTNRVAIGKSITVQSVNGPGVTVIQGNHVLGNNAVRCAYLTNGAALIGFNLTNGATRTSGDLNREQSGGGVWCEGNSTLVSNCMVAGCSAYRQGGAAFQGTLFNCILTNNLAGNSGGGACSNTLINCTLIRNSVSILYPKVGGGASFCILSNCLVSGNTCSEQGSGAGAYFSTLTTCVVSNNSALQGYGGGVCFGSVTNSLICSNQAEYGAGACSNVLNDCVLMNNIANFGGGGAFGGALTNCTLTNNAASYGGGAASNSLFNCLLIQNTAKNAYQGPAGGGGAYGCGLLNCALIGNQSVTGQYPAYGGGAYNGTLNNCIISNNSASYGGGAYSGMLNNCTLSGNSASYYGGGAESSILNTCTLTRNSAHLYGGGAESGTLNNCTLIGNSASSTGGGTDGATLNNCTLTGNSASYGGGTSNGKQINCTLSSNSALNSGGGAWYGTLNNCIVYYNTATSGTNYQGSSFSYSCTIPFPTNGFRNISNEPLFVNSAGGDYHLSSNSPCINSGYNAYVTTSTDLDGNPRIVGGTVDIGAYEYQTPASIISYAWLQQYGLPTDGSVDFADLDGDGMNNWQEWKAGTNPTNAASVLALYPPATTNSSGITVTWQSVNGVTYYLQSSTNFPTFTSIQSNIVGQAGTTSYTDTTATNGGPYFYRVGVQ